jgi:hypothetical protein
MAYSTAQEPTYCSVDDVAETLDLPDPNDPLGMFRFSDMSHPSYSRVEKMILGAEDEIDRRTFRSWRENCVVDHLESIHTYWPDRNGVRMDYWNNGGDFVQLEQNVLPWDPTKGDKLEVRTRGNNWRDITDTYNPDRDQYDPYDKQAGGFWIDYEMGKLYIRTRLFQTRANAVRISYRYGSCEPVPWAINRLCCLIVASQIVVQGVYDTKVGMGGDISGVKNQLLSSWEGEMMRLYSSYQRCGPVVSMLRG